MSKPKYNDKYKGIRFRVCLVRENDANEMITISNANMAYELVKEELISSDREKMLSIMLTAKNHLIGVETVSIGTLSGTSITPREVFKSAILANAASIILCHNHPSGMLEPSSEDIAMTRAMLDAGKLLGINVFDHLIVTGMGYKSLIEIINYPIERRNPYV